MKMNIRKDWKKGNNNWSFLVKILGGMMSIEGRGLWEMTNVLSVMFRVQSGFQ